MPVLSRPIARLVTIAVTAVVLCLVAARPASAQTAAASYQRAQAREQTARRSASTTPAALRAIATSYETIVRRHPTSGYSDNALWQAAGLLQLAYDKAHAKTDRDGAVRLLQWLKREYPKSPLIKQADDRLAVLTTAPARPATTPPPKTPDAPARPAAPQVAAVTPAPVTPPAAVTTPAAAPPPRASTTAASRPSSSAPPNVPAGPPPADAIVANSTVTSSPLPPPSIVDAQRKMDVSLREATHVTLPRGERVTMELTREVVYTTERAGTPDQLVITLPGVSAATAIVEAAAAIKGSLVRSVKVVPRLDGTQVRLELVGRPRYSMFPLYDPYRIVIDVEPDAIPAALVTPPARSAPIALAVPARSATAASRPAPAPTPVPVAPPVAAPASASAPDETRSKPMTPSSTKNGSYSLARQLGLGVSRIVIDPGHGGHDPGAQANGVSEAELVLDIAKRLESLLSDQPGFEIVLTRSTDEFIPLQERTAIANRENADLFLSIHANSSPQRETRGIETYFLNFASNPQAESVAARENASSGQGMRILPEIVKAIALNNKLTESRELAAQVQTSLMRRLSFQNAGMKDLGVKQAPFVVLIGAQMPSVLAEIAFLTNRSEAGLLKQTVYRQRIAQALCDAVLKYQASLKKVSTVAARTEQR